MSKFNYPKLGTAALASAAALMLSAGIAAAQAQDIGQLATSWRTQATNLAAVLPWISVILGLIFGAVTFNKLKAHNADPRENSIGTVMLTGAATVGLLFLGAFTSTIGRSIFGTGATGTGGTSTFTGVTP